MPDACPRGGPDHRNERPILFWIESGKARFGPQVPLVSVRVANGQLQANLDFRVRRYGRPVVRPHIARGSTDPGHTGWKDVTLAGLRSPWLEVTVNTTEAGFLKTPHYFAAVRVSPEEWPGGRQETVSLSSLGFIVHATSGNFTFRITRVGDGAYGVPETASRAEALGWSISWLGLEPVVGCPPVLDPGRIFLPSGVLSHNPALLFSVIKEADG
jgi:hypothetical protein